MITSEERDLVDTEEEWNEDDCSERKSKIGPKSEAARACESYRVMSSIVSDSKEGIIKRAKRLTA
jgi:hypothetical protein